MSVCPTEASHKLPDGTIQIDKSKCIGCQFCAMACPYGVRYLNEEERVVEKCTLCQQRTAQGELPQCVAQCGSRARFFGDLDEGLESFQALAPTHDLATPYEEMMQNRTTLGEWVEPFTEADVYHLTDTGNGPKHCYILRNRKCKERSNEVPAALTRVGPLDAAAPTGTWPCPLFRARRWPKPTWREGGAIPGACRTLADFLGRTYD